MTTVQLHGTHHLSTIARTVNDWFAGNEFETRVISGPNVFVVKARSSRPGPNTECTIEATILHEAGQTELSLGEGNWLEMGVSDKAWLLATRGRIQDSSRISPDLVRSLEDHLNKMYGRVESVIPTISQCLLKKLDAHLTKLFGALPSSEASFVS